MKTAIYSLFVCLFTLFSLTSNAQSCFEMDLEWQSEIETGCDSISMTMTRDIRGLPYLYIANKEAGLLIYDISDLSAPQKVADLPISQWEGLQLMNLSQMDNHLYLAIGNHFVNGQQSGMAVVDLTEPENPHLTDYYIHPNTESGAGIVKTEGNIAYLGAMKSGLILLDISDKEDIQLISQFVPDINFPVDNPNPALYNARGMEVSNGIVYLCYDAGGIRIINCSDPENPVETGRFANPALFEPINLPRAYNNLVLDDTLLYVTVDYCGLEVLSVADTSDIKLTGWWNPYGCPQNNWFTSPVHTNELHYDPDCQLVFLSTGESDMMVIDVSDPAQPDSCNAYGGTENGTGTWSVEVYENEIYLSYICAVIPFSSNWSGVKILTRTACSTTGISDVITKEIKVYPNPASGEFRLDIPADEQVDWIDIYDLQGRLKRRLAPRGERSLQVNIREWQTGLYLLKAHSAERVLHGKIVVH